MQLILLNNLQWTPIYRTRIYRKPPFPFPNYILYRDNMSRILPLLRTYYCEIIVTRKMQKYVYFYKYLSVITSAGESRFSKLSYFLCFLYIFCLNETFQNNYIWFWLWHIITVWNVRGTTAVNRFSAVYLVAVTY